MRPESITAIEKDLEDLSRLGGIASSCRCSHWLRAVGAIQDSSDGDWYFTDENWLVLATPASGPLDLLRRTAVLDPQYRFHLDILLSQVLQTIGAAARWNRFEELVFGQLLAFAPRFVQLLGQVASVTNTNPRDLSTDAWQKLAEGVEGNAHIIFQNWDRELWADVPGGAPALFPLLVDLYVPLRRHGCTLAADEYRLDSASAELLAAITERARYGEGILLEGALEPRLGHLLNLGLPVRSWALASLSADRRPVIGLVEPLRVTGTGDPRDGTEGVPLLGTDRGTLKNSRVGQSTATRPACLSEGFWTVVEGAIRAIAFPGLNVSEGWPRNPPDAPVWAQLPSSADLIAVATARRESVEVDQALFVVARHILFGLLLQILLLEALDRELGHESLALTPSPQSETASFNDVRVYYRPTQEQSPETGERITPQTYELGTFDVVVNSIAGVLGIAQAGATFTGEGEDFWSMGVRLLASLGLVNMSPSKDRWILHSDVLDRLHGGGLMTGVLRRGRNVRDRIRGHLQDLWSIAHDLDHQKGVPNA